MWRWVGTQGLSIYDWQTLTGIVCRSFFRAFHARNTLDSYDSSQMSFLLLASLQMIEDRCWRNFVETLPERTEQDCCLIKYFWQRHCTCSVQVRRAGSRSWSQIPVAAWYQEVVVLCDGGAPSCVNGSCCLVKYSLLGSIPDGAGAMVQLSIFPFLAWGIWHNGEPDLPCSLYVLPSGRIFCRSWLWDVLCTAPGYSPTDFVTLRTSKDYVNLSSWSTYRCND